MRWPHSEWGPGSWHLLSPQLSARHLQAKHHLLYFATSSWRRVLINSSCHASSALLFSRKQSHTVSNEWAWLCSGGVGFQPKAGVLDSCCRHLLKVRKGLSQRSVQVLMAPTSFSLTLTTQWRICISHSTFSIGSLCCSLAPQSIHLFSEITLCSCHITAPITATSLLRTPQQPERPGQSSPGNELPQERWISLAYLQCFVEQPLLFQHLCEALLHGGLFKKKKKKKIGG